MEYEFRINSLNGELVRREIALSQRDNEILALRQYISELEGRLGYNVSHSAAHQNGVEVAYRRAAQNGADGGVFPGGNNGFFKN
ncbi:MAG: hypothetical protein IKV55_03755, partial [Oscillospiraceae bacterium]|nr:hypothetical protein [Oscillospiraceae bacterium]